MIQKTFFILIHLILVALTVKCQSFEELISKYVYSIYGYEDSKFIGGSGFFIKQNNKLYFLTAKHVLSGCERGISKSKDSAFHSELNILLRDSDSLIVLTTKEIRDTISCDGVDLLVIPMPDRFNNSVNSIEQFVQAPLHEFENVVLYGFPFSLYYNNGETNLKPNPSLINLATNTFGVHLPMDSNGKIDSSLNMIVYSERIDLSTTNGYSGSPIFLKEKGTNNGRFLGLLSGAGEHANGKQALYLVNVQYIMDQIEKLK